MPKCRTCGGHVDWIETETSRVADDCPRCVPRGDEPCYFCGRKKESYLHQLCNRCREESEKRKRGE
jgi:hypothetical protein